MKPGDKLSWASMEATQTLIDMEDNDVVAAALNADIQDELLEESLPGVDNERVDHEDAESTQEATARGLRV